MKIEILKKSKPLPTNQSPQPHNLPLSVPTSTYLINPSPTNDHSII